MINVILTANYTPKLLDWQNVFYTSNSLPLKDCSVQTLTS